MVQRVNTVRIRFRVLSASTIQHIHFNPLYDPHIRCPHFTCGLFYKLQKGIGRLGGKKTEGKRGELKGGVER